MYLEELQIVDPQMVPGSPKVHTVGLETFVERVGSFLRLSDQLGAIQEAIEAEKLETEDERLGFPRVVMMVMMVGR
jgi:hypothetical protein